MKKVFFENKSPKKKIRPISEYAGLVGAQKFLNSLPISLVDQEKYFKEFKEEFENNVRLLVEKRGETSETSPADSQSSPSKLNKYTPK